MRTSEIAVVVGMGEVGQPLHRILSAAYRCIGVDVEPIALDRKCSVLHICYPFQTNDFVGTTCAYVTKYRPELVIIHSTVVPGTTREIGRRSATPSAYSPVRGKHARMESDMRRYRKFVSGCSADSTDAALQHLEAAGFTTETFRTPELGELAKLLETTWLGVMIGWAQEVERFAGHYSGSYDEVNAFIKEVDFLPSHIFPGFIGGHCVLPNIELLRKQFNSPMLEAVLDSNHRSRKQAA
jgi:UDP-N-acetyl-D-mannosaminuronate dehydrogenase